MDNANYTPQDLSRMRYMLPELEEKLKQNPKSLVLHNGIVRIREILGLPSTGEAIDPLKFIGAAEAVAKASQKRQ